MEARLCGDIERWLPRQPGISRDSFPPGGINPYKPEDNTDRGRIFYRFDDASSFDRLGRCFRSIEDQIRETVGISVGLETWWGDEVRVSSRKAKHEPHIESPSRVTDTPACHKPLG